MSSLSRAFTTRRVKNSIDLSDAARGKERSNIMQRSKTTKGQPVIRHKISAPMELVHTTNMLSYNAPDIRPQTGTDASSNSSRKSSEEDSESAKSAASSPPTSPDVSPHELSKESNHLSCFFVAPSSAMNPSAVPEVPAIPTIPKRALSHTKQASYDAVARQRSLSQLSKTSDKTVSSKASMTFSRASSGSSAASTMSHNSVTPASKAPAPPMPTSAFQQQQQSRHDKLSAESHPFGHELAQVTEIAEEFGIKDDIMYEEECALKAEGLCKFAAEDYLSEVQSLFASFFTDSHTPQRSMAAAWI
ncbi:hypothetical protein CTA2_13078 [Colletotrichum tanaceti]|uniref:Uncharacterized protein n=1 Tax=Colletotrichum tanaceti TaxID=1306861 RepID=A0A4U6X7N1_9PEZI|nr:hypothetical protein CTA2_13077 [Colletotrichum tanaceti]KAJ0164844.1 hypothetical protein CTA2_13078 [Colletotrichum tanaceti]TKW51511.1 hypothetical protein CTA1_7248 [Colletotrichum tanaceti]